MAISIHSFYSISFRSWCSFIQIRCDQKCWNASKILLYDEYALWYGATVSPIFLSTLYSIWAAIFAYNTHARTFMQWSIGWTFNFKNQTVHHTFLCSKNWLLLFSTRMFLYIPFHIHTEALNTIGDRWETFVSLGLFWFAFYFVCYYYFFQSFWNQNQSYIHLIFVVVAVVVLYDCAQAGSERCIIRVLMKIVRGVRIYSKTVKMYLIRSTTNKTEPHLATFSWSRTKWNSELTKYTAANTTVTHTHSLSFSWIWFVFFCCLAVKKTKNNNGCECNLDCL